MTAEAGAFQRKGGEAMSLSKRLKTLMGRVAGTLAFALLAFPLHVGATQVVHTSFVETLRQSDGVVLGRVLSKQSRWGDATKRWIVTDVELAVNEVVVSPVTEAPPVGGRPQDSRPSWR